MSKNSCCWLYYGDSSFVLESRHLGLVPASESNNKKNTIQKSAKKMSKNMVLISKQFYEYAIIHHHYEYQILLNYLQYEPQ